MRALLKTHIETPLLGLEDCVIPCSMPFMCVDAQTVKLLSRKLICSRSLDESLSILDIGQRPSVPLEQ
jgi:hypothetical protein